MSQRQCGPSKKPVFVYSFEKEHCTVSCFVYLTRPSKLLFYHVNEAEHSDENVKKKNSDVRAFKLWRRIAATCGKFDRATRLDHKLCDVALKLTIVDHAPEHASM